MEKNETYTWADLVGANCADDGDWDDVANRDWVDYRRAERDGWGCQQVWDGR